MTPVGNKREKPITHFILSLKRHGARKGNGRDIEHPCYYVLSIVNPVSVPKRSESIRRRNLDK